MIKSIIRQFTFIVAIIFRYGCYEQVEPMKLLALGTFLMRIALWLVLILTGINTELYKQIL
ncbi:MAG: hypothetical protein A3B13_02690 [Candidatus Liptonbacteria bacterium RIFCSPLOWO2_01_FULL_45_15]|uniref:Uncharacterized protein n=1 Tax=Candidatus Liptonbacteria bacterium RIFCSPLOWO2_01_FULL_45_15 TaxID=1798649 RepID=A0A1G2CHX4_9BACT|nr:MAG: hypothetical protein A3B13_02690 [Candidatus Liptonbacteria bacterium RIFCSPLOWO2_01_FULL_45_15]